MWAISAALVWRRAVSVRLQNSFSSIGIMKLGFYKYFICNPSDPG
jgi:hypothetical protein